MHEHDGRSPGDHGSAEHSPRVHEYRVQRADGSQVMALSGPLLDRIDIHVEVPAVKFREITAERTGETSAQIRESVVAARAASRNALPENATSPATPEWAPGI